MYSLEHTYDQYTVRCVVENNLRGRLGNRSTFTLVFNVVDGSYEPSYLVDVVWSSRQELARDQIRLNYFRLTFRRLGKTGMLYSVSSFAATAVLVQV